VAEAQAEMELHGHIMAQAEVEQDSLLRHGLTYLQLQLAEQSQLQSEQVAQQLVEIQMETMEETLHLDLTETHIMLLHTAVAEADIATDLETMETMDQWVKELEIETAEAQAEAVEQVETISMVQAVEAVEQQTLVKTQ
jgi:hypothetical protein